MPSSWSLTVTPSGKVSLNKVGQATGSLVGRKHRKLAQKRRIEMLSQEESYDRDVAVRATHAGEPSGLAGDIPGATSIHTTSADEPPSRRKEVTLWKVPQGAYGG